MVCTEYEGLDVSIPHRYGKNTTRLYLVLRRWMRVSIPHRYGKNLLRTSIA